VPALTTERLRELLHYDLKTGLFTWKVRSAQRIQVGDVAGTVNKGGYVQIGIDGTQPYAHRLAFLFILGTWPMNVVDHIDTDTSNNAWTNLRDTTQRANIQNRRRPQSNSDSGLLGVSWSAYHGRWRACLLVDGVNKHLGYFGDKHEAYAAYVSAKRQLHEGCTL
jgi:hypothetical protein